MLKKCELSKSTVDNLKKGSMTSAKTLSKIADYFDVSVDYLLGNTDIKEKNPSIQVRDEDDRPVVLSKDTLEIINSVRTRPEMKMLFSVSSKATPEDIMKAIKIIEDLRDISEKNG